MRPEHWLFTPPLRLRSLFRRARSDQGLDDELRDHPHSLGRERIGWDYWTMKEGDLAEFEIVQGPKSPHGTTVVVANDH